MMHPWDRERTWQDSPDQNMPLPAKGGAWVWVIAVIIAVVALFALANSGGGSRGLVAVPVGISLFFMFMFLINHRREMRHLQAVRRVRQMQQIEAPQPMAVGGPPPGAPQRDDASLRRIFDRFDLKVIEHCRANTWEPKEISKLLEMARDFVDQPHAASLLRAGEDNELSRHLEAALERALLQYDIDHNRKGDRNRGTYSYGDGEPPF